MHAKCSMICSTENRSVSLPFVCIWLFLVSVKISISVIWRFLFFGSDSEYQIPKISDVTSNTFNRYFHGSESWPDFHNFFLSKLIFFFLKKIRKYMDFIGAIITETPLKLFRVLTKNSSDYCSSWKSRSTHTCETLKPKKIMKNKNKVSFIGGGKLKSFHILIQKGNIHQKVDFKREKKLILLVK